MKIELISNGTRKELTVTHDDCKLVWSSNAWKKFQSCETDQLFKELNGYWNSKSLTWQNKIYGLYQKAYELLLDELSVEELSVHLSVIATEIIDHHPYDEVYKYITKNEFINTDYDKLHDEIIDYTKVNLIESQTYCKPDYVRLAVLVIIFKTMAPVWGMYTTAVNKNGRPDSVGNKHKEVAALKLVEGCHLFQTEAFLKLNRYAVTWSRKSETSSKAAITHGISVSDIPFFFVSFAVVKRMMIQGFGPDSDNLISAMWSVFDQANKDLTKGITEKAFNPGEDDKYGIEKKSIADINNMSAKIPVHYYSMYDVYVANHRDAFLREVYMYNFPEEDVDYDLYLETVEKFRRTISEIYSFRRQKYHGVIMGIVLAPLINVDELNNIEQITWAEGCAAASAACLKLRGYEDLALLISSPSTMNVLESEEISSPIRLNDLTSTNKWRLEAYCQYAPQRTTKSNTGISFIQSTVDQLLSQVNDFDMQLFVDIRNRLVTFLTTYQTQCKKGNLDDELLPPEYRHLPGTNP